MRVGELSEQSVGTLRLIKDAFGVTFKIKDATNVADDTVSSKIAEEEDSMKGNNSEKVRVQNSSKSMSNNGSHSADNQDKENLYSTPGNTYFLSCLGSGYINMSRKIR